MAVLLILLKKPFQTGLLICVNPRNLSLASVRNGVTTMPGLVLHGRLIISGTWEILKEGLIFVEYG